MDCIDGLELFPVWDDGTGFCHEPSICLNGNTMEPSDECTCEENCLKCGSVGGFLYTHDAPNNCSQCKAKLVLPTPSDED